MIPIKSTSHACTPPYRLPAHQLEKGESRAIYLALIGQHENNPLVVRFFADIFNSSIQAELNDIIKDINAFFSFEAVTISSRIILLLREHGIELSQNSEGLIKMVRLIKTTHKPERRMAITAVLTLSLPDDLTEIICSYDAQIKICRQTYGYIYEVLQSDDIAQKRLLIELAIAQNQTELLNEVFEEVKFHSGGLNLCGITLSGMNLTGLDLTNANLSCADLTGAILSRVDLSDSDLTNANLNSACLDCADLSHCNMTGTKLRHARLFLANLQYSNLTLADLAHADLNLANLHYSILYRCNLYHATMYRCALNEISLEFAETNHALYFTPVLSGPAT